MVYDLLPSGSHLVYCSLLAIIKNVIAKGSAETFVFGDSC
jgi:hypothetical protein